MRVKHLATLLTAPCKIFSRNSCNRLGCFSWDRTGLPKNKMSLLVAVDYWRMGRVKPNF